MVDAPLEVALVAKVRGCRTCQWFWGATPPYGDFPVFDWQEDFPEAIRNQKQTTDPWMPPKPILRGRAMGHGQVDPGIMHGCRKAPIMTIGINPNLTAYYASDDGARWSYPNFSNDARYAYYYRHHNVYQESLDPAFIRDNIVAGTEITADKDGWLLSAERSSDHRWVLLRIQYLDEESPREIEVAWTHEQRFVVLVERSRRQDPDKLGFEAGDVIGGKLAGLTSDDVQVFENATGYYQRYVQVLDRFKERAGGAIATADLSISEDVAQHDMIGCASPGWSDRYDIPRDRIARNCVRDHAYLIAQLVQSRPAVIVIVGGSSLAMFAEVMAPYLIGFDYQEEADDNALGAIKETFELLKETVLRERFLHINIDGYELKSRLVVSPHFSYRDNFRPHSRLSEAAWTAFRDDFVDDAETLRREHRIEPNSWNNVVPIAIDGPEDSIRSKIGAAAWQVLLAYHYDPMEMLADVLIQETNAGRLTYDAAIGHLRRAEGSCQFCVNESWQFPEGCPYGKPDESAPNAGELEAIVRSVIATGDT